MAGGQIFGPKNKNVIPSHFDIQITESQSHKKHALSAALFYIPLSIITFVVAPLITLILALTITSPLSARAQAVDTTPKISYISVFPPVVVSRQYTSLIWAIERGGGHSITFPCVAGIKIKRADTSAEIPCGTAYSASARATDDLMFSVVNISGVSRILDITVTPKDGAGLSYSNAAKTVSLTIGPITQPVTSFEASSQVLQSASSTTFSWVADSDLPGINLWFSCNSAVKATTSVQITDGYYLPCNQPVLPSILGTSGSATFTFINENVSDVDIVAQILPSTGKDQNDKPEYDATRAMNLILTIRGSRPITPQIDSLEAESQKNRLKVASGLINEPLKILSGATSTLSWTGITPSGSNIIFQCTQGIRPYIIATSTAEWLSNASTSEALSTLLKAPTMPCDRPALSTNLISDATTSMVAFVNETDIPRTIRVGILPARSNGELSQGQFISFYVFGKSVTKLPDTATPTPTPTTTATPKAGQAPKAPSLTTPTVKAGSTSGSRIDPGSITLNLKPGSRSTQVTSLQRLLAQDTAIYPEAAITGYFGPATERAVKRFQLKHRIHRKGDDGYGIVDKETRAMLIKVYK